MFQYIIYEFHISNNIPENWHTTKCNNSSSLKKYYTDNETCTEQNIKNWDTDSGWLLISTFLTTFNSRNAVRIIQPRHQHWLQKE